MSECEKKYFKKIENIYLIHIDNKCTNIEKIRQVQIKTSIFTKYQNQKEILLPKMHHAITMDINKLNDVLVQYTHLHSMHVLCHFGSNSLKHGGIVQ